MRILRSSARNHQSDAFGARVVLVAPADVCIAVAPPFVGVMGEAPSNNLLTNAFVP